jgi:signal transduction histidine kinase
LTLTDKLISFLLIFIAGEGHMGRKLGIGIGTEAPWGSHFAFFYEIKDYLIKVALPFLKSGLDSDEYCLWVTHGFKKGEADQIMREAIPNFDIYKKKKQIEVIPDLDWYLAGDRFDPKNVLQKYSDKYGQALANGYDGLRVVADMSWAGREDWKSVNTFEVDVDKLIEKNYMLMICSYSFKECSPEFVTDILASHHLGIIRSEENFEIIETSSIKINANLLGKEIITRKKLEEQLIQSQKMEAVGRLAAGVAHDFNNLLMIVMNYCDLLMNKLPPTDPLSDYVHKISNAADQAKELASGLLTLGRGQLVEAQVIDLNDVIINSGKMLRSMAGGKVDLILTLGQDLGRIKAIPGKLQQALLNLVANSLDAMPDGGKITIETVNVEFRVPHLCRYSHVPPGAYVMLSVRDTGAGMSQEVQSHIFEPFYTTKEEGKGTGLGLANVYGTIKQLGGHIELKSHVGVGTTFRFYFPRTEEVFRPKPEVKAVTPADGLATVLVIEGDDVLRDLTCKTLKMNGYNVLEASNYIDALLICQRQEKPIDLILTDIIMPQISGRDLLRSMLQLHRDAQVIYISESIPQSYFTQEELDKGINFLQKPFKLMDLIKKIREIISLISA